MISDCEYNNIKLPSKIYQKIEENVSMLYVELNINKMPIDPFDVANRRCYIVKPFSDLKYDVRSLLLSKELDGTSYFNPMLNKFVICYDDNQCTNRIRFTLMHEIGHIDLGHRQESDLAGKMADYYGDMINGMTGTFCNFQYNEAFNQEFKQLKLEPIFTMKEVA